MSSLVLLGEQPSALELAALLDRLSGAAASPLLQLAKDGKLATLLETGIIAQSALLLAASEEDFTAALTLSFAVLTQLSSAAEAAATTNAIAKLLTTDPSTRATLKIKTLTNLINVLGGISSVTSAQRFALLLQLLEFALVATPASFSSAAAAASSPAVLVLQPLSSLDAQIAAWKLSSSEATALMLASYKLAVKAGPVIAQSKNVKAKGDEFAAPQAATIMYNLGAQPTIQQEYLFAVLKSLDSAAPATLREKQFADLALQASIASISNGLAASLHTLDPTHLFQLAAVQALGAAGASASGASAFALLRILVDADLAAWIAFDKSASGSAFLKENAGVFGMDSETLLRKVRTLALCNLAVTAQAAGTGGDNILAYASIQQKLQLPASQDNEEIEAAVIDAVMVGRMDAKMDQEAETLCVKRVSGGVSVSLYSGPNSKAAWAALGSRLAVWRDNIHNVLATLSAGHQQAMQGAEEVGEEIQ